MNYFSLRRVNTARTLRLDGTTNILFRRPIGSTADVTWSPDPCCRKSRRRRFSQRREWTELTGLDIALSTSKCVVSERSHNRRKQGLFTAEKCIPSPVLLFSLWLWQLTTHVDCNTITIMLTLLLQAIRFTPKIVSVTKALSAHKSKRRYNQTHWHIMCLFLHNSS